MTPGCSPTRATAPRCPLAPWKSPAAAASKATARRLARVAGREPLLLRATPERGRGGSAYFLGTLPGPGSSSLARDGVVMFALLHRALDEAAGTLGKAQIRPAAAGALGLDPGAWHAVEAGGRLPLAEELPLHAGVVASGDRLVALNRPPSEDAAQTVPTKTLNELFAGLDFQVITDTLENKGSLTNRGLGARSCLVLAAALVGEALLTLPTPARSCCIHAKWQAGADGCCYLTFKEENYRCASLPKPLSS